jgi:hypothetical protein
MWPIFMEAMMLWRVKGALMVGLSLTGCTSYMERSDLISLHTGEAVAVNKILHIADPWPVASRNRTLSFEARRFNPAMDAYYKQPVNAAPVANPAATLAATP